MSKRITDPQALATLREKAREALELRQDQRDVRITVHMGTCGIAAGARDILAHFIAELGARKIDKVTLRQAGCAGLCAEEPMLTLTDKAGKEYCYGKLDKTKVRDIIEDHVVGGRPVTKLLLTT